MDADAKAAGQREKLFAASSSVVAAVGLTGMKLIVGLSTGSLGILSEAAHSGLDLAAALMTLFAVRISHKPPDDRHRYGHGKIENLSALFETVLLLLTCAWIISEAIGRLFFRPVEVEATIWSFVVMSTSIVVDLSRSRVLARAARKYKSQALEADALHFSTDVYSSLVVILGLIGVTLSKGNARLAFLGQADAVAALGVAIIVTVLSLRLGRRTIEALLDTAPGGLVDAIKKSVEAVPGIADCHSVRIRPSGPIVFVDVHVTMDGHQSLNDAHLLTEGVEAAIRGLIPEADVTVHPEPRRAELPASPGSGEAF